jgi:NAD(P)-dependent dehydrogenase (short-subunit alcohol dehydrogenase family)
MEQGRDGIAARGLGMGQGDRHSEAASVRRALVTGGARGIGWAAAAALADAGHQVIATGLTEAEVEAAAPHDGVTFRRLDVTDAAMCAGLIAAMPRIDALVNAAGIIQRGGREFNVDAFRLTLEVNLIGTMRMCVGCLEKLQESGGAVVNIASMLSFFGAPLAPGYAASKGGVAQLTKSLAAAWAKDGVRVNAVAPGWIATDLTQALQEDETRSAGILARTPMGRWGKPDDIGGAIRFLCSDEARFITGAILPVDGGYLTV